MKRKMIQLCALGVLVLISVSTKAHAGEDGPDWVQADPQDWLNKPGTHLAVFGGSVVGATAGGLKVGSHFWDKSVRFGEQANKATQAGDKALASRLIKKQGDAEFKAIMSPVVVFLGSMGTVVGGVVLENKLASMRMAAQNGKASAKPAISGETSKPVLTATSNDAAE
jgi:hypothetical protein